MESSISNNDNNLDDDYFASQNEAWIILHQNLLEEQEKTMKKNDDGDILNDDVQSITADGSLQSIMMILRTARIANLQSALAKASADAAENVEKAINIKNLIYHVQHEADKDVDYNRSLTKSISHKTSIPSSGTASQRSLQSNYVPSEEDLCSSIDIDSFFDDYPECNRMANISVEDDKYDSEDNSSDSDESNDGSIRVKGKNYGGQNKFSIDTSAAEVLTEHLPVKKKKKDNISRIKRKHRNTNSTVPLAERPIPSSSSQENQIDSNSSLLTGDIDKQRSMKSDSYSNNDNNNDHVVANTSTKRPYMKEIKKITNVHNSNNYNQQNDSNDPSTGNAFEYTPASQLPTSRPSSSSSSICDFEPRSPSFNHPLHVRNRMKIVPSTSNFTSTSSSQQRNTNSEQHLRTQPPNNNNDLRRINNVINPYKRSSSSSQNHQQSHVLLPSKSSAFVRKNTHDNNNKDSWTEHQNQLNPFQTAREVAIVEQNHPHRDPYRRNYNNSHSNHNDANNGHDPTIQRSLSSSGPQQQYQNQQHRQYGYEYQHSNNNTDMYNLGGVDSSDATNVDPGSGGVSGGPAIPASLTRKFQPPTKGLVKGSQQGNTNKNSIRSNAVSRASSSKANKNNSHGRKKGLSKATNRKDGGRKISNSNESDRKDDENDDDDNDADDDDELPEELKHLDKELVKKIENEIMVSGDTITFDDIAGLPEAKATILEVVCWPMKRPDLFTGLRRAPNGLLLYGPPGTGKTLIGKAIAHESGATFFSISSSSLTSKWIGEGEKLVKTLFAVAGYRQPAVVFIDEIDSLLTQRKESENEASRRIKTEFLVQLDGTGTSGQGRVLIIGATNRPQEMDDAARRRFTKRLYIPLPEMDDRKALIQKLLETNKHKLIDVDIEKLAKDTVGFSGADLKSLCTDAAMGPIRDMGSKALEVNVSDVPPISLKHFKKSLKGTRPSVAPEDLKQYIEYDRVYGTKRADDDDSDDDE